MVLFVGYHATSPARRPSISEHGLRANCPAGIVGQPYGVYVFDPHMRNDGVAVDGEWESWGDQDLWRVAYCGPMVIDQLLCNAVILPSVTDVTLVTGNE